MIRPAATWFLATLIGAFLAPTWAFAADDVDVVASTLVDALPEGPSVSERLAEIRRRVHEALEYPPLARAERQGGEVHVGFEIDAKLRASGVRMVRSSGHPLLDRAAQAAVHRAAPLPYVYGRLVLPVRFDLHDDAP